MTAALKSSQIGGGTGLGIDPSKFGLADPGEQTEERLSEKDVCRAPLEPEAYKWWREGDFRFFFVLDHARDFARALGRPLRLDEVQMLVGNDGSQVKSSVGEKNKFQPIWWVQPMPKVLDVVREVRDVVQAVERIDREFEDAFTEDRRGALQVLRFGNFFQIGNELHAVHGRPYFVDGSGHRINKASAYAKAAFANAQKRGQPGYRWGTSQRDIQNVERLRALRYERRESLAQKRADLRHQEGSDIEALFG